MRRRKNQQGKGQKSTKEWGRAEERRKQENQRGNEGGDGRRDTEDTRLQERTIAMTKGAKPATAKRF